MKKFGGIITIALIIICILIGSIAFSWDKDFTSSSKNQITKEFEIDGKKVSVLYLDGNKLSESISYGNKISKTLKITNKNKDAISFSLKIENLEISNDLVTYNLYTSSDNNIYDLSLKNESLKDKEYVGYNLVVDGNSVVYVKLEIKSNKENENTTVKGKIVLDSNLSDREKMIISIDEMINTINKKIDDLNGIVTAGIYSLNVNELNSNYNGTILVDATDYADIKYILFIYNDSFYVENVSYSSLTKANIKDKTGDLYYDEQTSCSLYTKDTCNLFSNLTYNEYGGKSTFKDSVNKIVRTVKANFKMTEKKVYVYDVANDITNETGIRGYILIDNTKDKAEYYLYVTNNIYMISGYNLTKLGEVDEDSSTIRAYNETSFNLSSISKLSVCNFSGFTECYDVNNALIS